MGSATIASLRPPSEHSPPIAKAPDDLGRRGPRASQPPPQGCRAWPQVVAASAAGICYESPMADLFEAAGLTPHAPSPLADRLRPQTLGEVVGQDHLLGEDGPIGRMAQAHRLASMILWGPPGTGKTTIARLLANCLLYTSPSPRD